MKVKNLQYTNKYFIILINFFIFKTDTEKILSFKINKDGFKIDTDIEEIKISQKPSITKKGPHNQDTKEIMGSLSDFEFINSFKLLVALIKPPSL